MEQVLELSVPARPEFVAVVRLVVSSLAGARRNIADSRMDDLKLAVSEAWTNAMEAHHSSDVHSNVIVQVFEADDRIEVRINDSGPGFDPERLSSPPAVTDPERLNFERGLGIPLMRTLVDQVEFRDESATESSAGTSVRMTFFGSRQGPGADETTEILRSVVPEEE